VAVDLARRPSRSRSRRRARRRRRRAGGRTRLTWNVPANGLGRVERRDRAAPGQPVEQEVETFSLARPSSAPAAARSPRSAAFSTRPSHVGDRRLVVLSKHPPSIAQAHTYSRLLSFFLYPAFPLLRAVFFFSSLPPFPSLSSRLFPFCVPIPPPPPARPHIPVPCHHVVEDSSRFWRIGLLFGARETCPIIAVGQHDPALEVVSNQCSIRLAQTASGGRSTIALPRPGLRLLPPRSHALARESRRARSAWGRPRPPASNSRGHRVELVRVRAGPRCDDTSRAAPSPGAAFRRYNASPAQLRSAARVLDLAGADHRDR